MKTNREQEVEINQLHAASKALASELLECLEYFEDRMDADCDDRGFVPDTEMQFASRIKEVLQRAGVEC